MSALVTADTITVDTDALKGAEPGTDAADLIAEGRTQAWAQQVCADAINAARARATDSPANTTLTADQIRAIEATGADDYTDRADDVAAGQQDATWAWPLQTADEAYINAVGTEQICRDLGLSTDDDTWTAIVGDWCDAFRRGYRAAHAAAVVPS